MLEISGNVGMSDIWKRDVVCVVSVSEVILVASDKLGLVEALWDNNFRRFVSEINASKLTVYIYPSITVMWWKLYNKQINKKRNDLAYGQHNEHYPDVKLEKKTSNNELSLMSWP